MSGWKVAGVNIDPYGKGKEAAGHVVGQVLGDEARQVAEEGLDVFANTMTNPEFLAEQMKKMIGGGGGPNLQEGGLNRPEFGGGAGTPGGGLQQADMVKMLQARAAGTGGPSAAEAQLQQATDRNMRGAMAMAASGRGNAALAGQAAGQQRAQMGQEAASQSASLRAQEQQQATSQLGQAIGGTQQQELGYAGLEAQMYGADQNRIAAENAAALQASAAKQQGMMGAVTGIGAAALPLMFSDERVKKNKANVPDADVDEFFKALKAKSFEYKDPHTAGTSGGEKVGMMAQDVDQTKLGEKLFSRSADGISQYDPQVLDGILLAGMKKLMKDQNYGND